MRQAVSVHWHRASGILFYMLRDQGRKMCIRDSPIGDKTDKIFNVRIIAATNEDLEAAVSEKRFRQDLLYLSLIHIWKSAAVWIMVTP